ncbi:MAG: hypothetical protein ACREJC_23300, partial [Tepidisphaeraceae bacterium]
MKSLNQRQNRMNRAVEALERRVMMDGNVTALLSGGDLTVRGDRDDNDIIMTRRNDGRIRIAGREGTTVNGHSFVDLSAPSDDVLIQMQQGGEDFVEIQGRFTVPDDFNARLGAGELLIEGSFGPVVIGGDMYVTTGDDGHVTLRNEVETRGATSIDSGGDVNLVGGQATVPNFAAARFDRSLTINNPYFPVVPGAQYRYLAEIVDEDTGDISTESIIVEMLAQTKTITGVQVRIVRDRVFDEDGRIIEDTFDWYAQDNNGNIWYFGEDVTNYEYDASGNATIDKHGSWIAGENGALPGIIMEAKPRVGYAYYQEFAPGNVLDQAVG